MLGALSSHMPFVSAPDGSGLDKESRYMKTRLIMNAPCKGQSIHSSCYTLILKKILIL